MTRGYVSFQYPDVVKKYYKARHAVDDNNNIRQGSFSLEAILGSKRWDMRQFHALLAMSEVNAMLGYNHFVLHVRGKQNDHSLLSFRRKLAQQLIENSEYVLARGQHQESPPHSISKRACLPEHNLVTAPLHAGKCNGGPPTVAAVTRVT